MGFFDVFRRRPPVRDADALATFVDEHAAFVVQKGIYEYSRARAGHYAKVLFAEKAFQEEVERCRWQAYPLGLAMVGEVVETALRPHAGEARRAVLDGIIVLTLAVFDRYPVPLPIGESAWRAARTELEHRLDLAGARGPKLVKDIAEPYAEPYFALMPIHERLRARDFPTMRNHLRLSLVNVYDEFARRMDGPALVSALRPPRSADAAGAPH